MHDAWRLEVPGNDGKRRAIVAALHANRAVLIEALRTGRFSGSPRENRFGDEPARFDERIGTWLDLLAGHVNGKPGYAALLAGQTVLEIHRPERGAAENRRATLDALDAIGRDLAGAAGIERSVLQATLDEAFRGLRTEPRSHVRTLLIGDCLMGEIAGLAADPLAREGVSFDAFPLAVRDPADLDRKVARLPDQAFDAIFFSPFSHARLAEIEALLDPRRALQSTAALVDAIIAQTKPLIAHLATRFECPIYIHNAGLVVRATTPAKGMMLNALTARRRVHARTRLNDWLRDHVDARNAAGARRLHIIDEIAIVAGQGYAAGLYLYASDFQHATALSRALAEEYQRRIHMLATLKGRKLVVCDLDHTLWDGVIGEGTVRHYEDRQHSLRRLKVASGVILSIASKNDPHKVHFGGGVLALDDFVAPQISWGRKVEAVARLREQLNLQYRHMVFVDDRPDERAFMAAAYPEMLVVDANDAESWARISLWADVTEGASDLDRTQLYQQQLARDSFVGEDGVAQLDTETLDALGLRVEVREAGKADLKRFAELINRTNQWNMTGGRTTLARVREQAVAADSILLLAAAHDKFGDMGDVCAASVSIAGTDASIDTFVLSCRVFGYGVEGAMLAAIRERAAALGAIALAGRFAATTQNQMARDMYRDHGFEDRGDGLFVTALQATAATPS